MTRRLHRKQCERVQFRRCFSYIRREGDNVDSFCVASCALAAHAFAEIVFFQHALVTPTSHCLLHVSSLWLVRFCLAFFLSDSKMNAMRSPEAHYAIFWCKRITTLHASRHLHF